MVCLAASAADAQSDLRGWYADGQTWLVWRNTDPQPDTYDIYRSDAPITDLADAEWTGRVFPEDARAWRLKIAWWFAEWVLPTANGGTYELGTDEALFVYTPHAEGTEYFAVVATGETGVSDGNRTGAVVQKLEPIQCHPQRHSWTVEGGREYTIYAHWVDGRDDWKNGRADYPVMANELGGGVGHVFAVLEPEAGRTGEPMPAVIGFHGGGESNYFNFGADINPRLLVDTTLQSGLVISLDDAILVRKPDWLGQPYVDDEVTRWFGYWEHFNRFEVPTEDLPGDAVIVNYTMRRIDFILDWLLEHEEIDPARVSLFGVSGGGAAVGFLARWRPETFAAIDTFVTPLEGTVFPFARYMQGTIDANLTTNLPGDMGLRDWYWMPNRLDDSKDMPFMRIIMGKQDTLGPWETVVAFFDTVESQRWGAQIYWDERDHILNWLGAHWVGSERHNLEALTKYRGDQSFPAFHNTDEDLVAPGRQPDPGYDGRQSGDPWGTWGAYFDWDTETITDTADEWGVTFWLYRESEEFENDNAPMDAIGSDMSIRRPQFFKPAPGSDVLWTLTENEEVVDQGRVTVMATGLVTIHGLVITPAHRRLTIEAVETDDDFDDDDTGNVDDDTTDGGDDDTTPRADDDDDDDEDDDGCGC